MWTPPVAIPSISLGRPSDHLLFLFVVSLPPCVLHFCLLSPGVVWVFSPFVLGTVGLLQVLILTHGTRCEFSMSEVVQADRLLSLLL